MNPIELTGHVDEQRRLSVELPANVPPGPVRVIIEPIPDEEDERSPAWARAIAAAWAADWSDSCEDIYTLEDGKPEDEPR